ncbi:MAG: amylo-alpha-1,6-glucosidase [Methanothrix sp.]|nr:amylo-alpha-1,6-glucosidase [Methanothrix sp.]
MMAKEYTIMPRSYEDGAAREWLVSNGLGGYASATAVGSNTRSYHGLLVAALKPPTNRWLLLSALDEEVSGVSLANHQYPGVIHPQGFLHLREFRIDPLPRFIYSLGTVRIEKTVFMVNGENTTIICYRISNGQGLMRIYPLVHSRSFHAASDLPQIRQEPQSRGTRLKSSCNLALISDKARYIPHETVYYNFEYEEERRRGLAWRENLLCPGSFELELAGDANFAIVASTWRSAMPDVYEEVEKKTARLKALRSPVRRLAQAADSFLVQRDGEKSIIAGYHWFDDWGRDAMISLPGLLLCSQRFEDAAAVLRSFACAMKDGVLPNDLGAMSYNTADASLWFIQAVYAYYDHSHDISLVRLLWPKLQEVLRRYSSAGEGFGMDKDCLIRSGPALTWMDARVSGRSVIFRAGKCCEINALWYFGLKKMEALARALGEPWECELAKDVRQSYQRFWNSETGCLFDVIDPEDASIRPNQIIAAAVPELLPMIKRKSILEVVTRDLLTPFGLRTLSLRDPRYIGRYEGGPWQRDGAYHQGTVWPWLMGPYVDALLSVNDYSDESRKLARSLLQPLLELEAGCANTIPEVFDGDPPHRPGGCISQAWSVAEVLRAWAKAA